MDNGMQTDVKYVRVWRLGGEKPHALVSGNVEKIEEYMYKDVVGKQMSNSGKEVQIKVEPSSDSNVPEQAKISRSGASGEDYCLASDRTRRQIVTPLKYRENDDISVVAFNVAEDESTNEPLSYEEVVNSFDKVKWFKAMDEEIEYLYKNVTWVLTDKPKDK